MVRTYTGISPYVLNYGREYSQEVQNSNPARVKVREEVHTRGMFTLNTLIIEAHVKSDEMRS
jgi:hypothetical protein